MPECVFRRLDRLGVPLALRIMLEPVTGIIAAILNRLLREDDGPLQIIQADKTLLPDLAKDLPILTGDELRIYLWGFLAKLRD